jgi:hypothetical protein
VNRVSNPEFDSGTLDWQATATDTFVIDGTSAASGVH